MVLCVVLKMPLAPQEHTLVESGTPRASQPLEIEWTRYKGSQYLIGARVASGGMGTVHVGLKQGALGFQRVLAIKRLQDHLAHDPDFVARFKDEIRLVSRLNHANVVQTLDVLQSEGELALVMEFVDGVTLHQLLKDAAAARVTLPIPVVVGIVAQALHGLHAAHELRDDHGQLLQLVHRDVSPQNIMVGRDGLVKMLDFGVAKASSEVHVTRTGQLAGKAPYMAPEQILGSTIDRRTDVFAAGVVLWEALTGQRLFQRTGGEGLAFRNVLEQRITPPSQVRAGLDPALERIVLRALERQPSRRYGSARDFAIALEEVVPETSLTAIGGSVLEICRGRFAETGESRFLPTTNGSQEVATILDSTASQGATSAPDVSISRVTRQDPQEEETLLRSPSLPVEVGKTGAELDTSDVQVVPVDDLGAVQLKSGRPLLVGAVAGTGLVLVALGVALVGDTGSSDGSRRLTVGEPSPANRATAPETIVETPADAPAADEPSQRAAAEREAHAGEPYPDSNTNAAVDARPAAPRTSTPSALAVKTSSPQASATPRRTTSTSSATPRNATKRVAAPNNKAPQGRPSGSGVTKRVAAPDDKAPQKRPSGSGVKPGCSPPTYTDADGIRHFKAECL